MRFSISLACSCAFVGSHAAAQSVDLSQLRPVTGSAKHAGVYNLTTGKFLPAGGGASLSGSLTIYLNTCSSPSFFYATIASCEDYYDEGRVPEVVPSYGQTWYPDHRVTGIEIAYCTGAVTGTVDLDWELYDTQFGLGNAGSCTFGTGGVPPKFTAGIQAFSSSVSGFPLPGATGGGGPGCWIVGFTASGTSSACLDSGGASADQFVFRFSQNNTIAQVGIAGAGPWLAGNPNAAAGGAGTFTIPPGTDPFSGGPCGHGLDTQDLFWLNTDGSAIGVTPPPCPDGGPAVATGCYWFGGFPVNPFASFYLMILADGSCSETGVTNKYCTAKVNSLGCTPTVAWSGLPSTTGCATQPFTLMASNLIGKSSSVWFYGTSGLQGVPFQGGHLCIKPPTTRLAVLSTLGSAATCTGTNSSNFNAQICSGSDPALVAGALVGAQCYSRDLGSPSKTNLTEGISFVIFP